MRTIENNNYRRPKKSVSAFEIKKLQEEGYTITEIAKKCGVSRQAIYNKLNKEAERQIAVKAGKMSEITTIKMGDDNIGMFVNYHKDLIRMGQGVNKKDPEDLAKRFAQYLNYCAEHNIMPNNSSAYLAMGVFRQEMSEWRNGNRGTPEHKEFAQMVNAFFASIHEQGAAEGIINPILGIFWQKAYDGLTDQPKIEVELNNPLGEKRSAADIAKEYSDVDLPD